MSRPPSEMPESSLTDAEKGSLPDEEIRRRVQDEAHLSEMTALPGGALASSSITTPHDVTRASIANEFEQQASLPGPGFFRELWDFLRDNKKWWLTPILIVLLLAALLVMLSGSALAPFIYPLF